ncbi:hypothetical protein DCAR_0102575 [Daucus carota subsp. sativus]|uniref:Uncharacterized protein n=1 Tax=Daucus carota subsp. sativus TaxID=79200 RepID=A0A161X7W9_DAUCS|nr:PREDICTED: uncharacterized protein LOC108193936 [Daucus carota subsp. sativus]WOG83400.1 hypothetical protein DCAR_0102575 [Daucus carota subsp. sativus]
MVNVVDDDYGDASMQCTYHPYKNNSPSGGICAFCLQEKLGKLVSSPFLVTTKATASSSSTSHHSSSVLPINANNNPYHHFKKSRNPFLPTPKNKHQNHPPSSSSNAVTFNRSKSTVMRGTNLVESSPVDDLSTPQKRGFWSFTHLSKRHKIKQLASIAKIRNEEGFAVEENGSGLDRKVSRSRSVGGGNWSISGDILGKLSTRFGECALRRVESQREGNPRLGLGLSVSDKDF